MKFQCHERQHDRRGILESAEVVDQPSSGEEVAFDVDSVVLTRKVEGSPSITVESCKEVEADHAEEDPDVKLGSSLGPLLVDHQLGGLLLGTDSVDYRRCPNSHEERWDQRYN